MKSIEEVKNEIRKILKENNCALTSIIHENSDESNIFIVQRVGDEPEFSPWND